jgi:hypothetical protein
LLKGQLGYRNDAYAPTKLLNEKKRRTWLKAEGLLFLKAK